MSTLKTLRTLESLIRLSEARARMRWSQHVTRQDVLDARSLIHAAWGSAGVDMASGGAINFAKVFGGHVAEGADGRLAKRLEDIIKGQGSEGKKELSMHELLRAVGGKSGKVSMEELAAAVRVLELREVIQGFDARMVYLRTGGDGGGGAPAAPRAID